MNFKDRKLNQNISEQENLHIQNVNYSISKSNVSLRKYEENLYNSNANPNQPMFLSNSNNDN